MSRIVVTGLIAQYPLGGVTWDYLQYVLGLKQMGHEVFYVEDSGQWPFNPIDGGISKNCHFNVEYLSRVMAKFGLDKSWAYRFPWQSQWFGLGERERIDLFNSTDALLNVSGSLARPDEYRKIPMLIYIDSDPVFTQIKLARGQLDFRTLVDVHDIHFTFGENLPDEFSCTGQNWIPTRQPIVLSEWSQGETPREVFTTVMNWTSYKPIRYQGRTYGQKDIEFERFLDLPVRVPNTALEIAVNAGKTRRTPRDHLKRNGWHVVNPDKVCPDLESYRAYIENSKAEWSVAKNGYVEGQAGWFSCRSACYLAAGKPVVVQDTGFANALPVGEGILVFADMEGAVDAIRRVEADYERHSSAARAIAEEYFDSRGVLTRLIDDALCNKTH
jgi:hypothetical protein